jgi:hypothetical protein
VRRLLGTGVHHLINAFEQRTKKARLGAAWKKIVAHNQYALMLNDDGSWRRSAASDHGHHGVRISLRCLSKATSTGTVNSFQRKNFDQ